MNCSRFLRVFAAWSIVSIVVLPLFAGQPGNELGRLKPLTGGEWVCTSWDGEKPKHEQILCWDMILEQNAIRETVEKPEIGFSREGFMYWDGERQRVVSLIITNNGFVGHAEISWEGDKIVMLGKLVVSDGRTMNTKETFELISDGKLRSVSYNPTEDGWVQRHVLEYER